MHTMDQQMSLTQSTFNPMNRTFRGSNFSNSKLTMKHHSSLSKSFAGDVGARTNQGMRFTANQRERVTDAL
jgi:hypothetical protein